MVPSRRVKAAMTLVVWLLAGVSFAEPEFRLGIDGRPAGNDGFLIQKMSPSSALLSLRDKDGQFLRAEPGDRVLTLDQRPFSPELLRTMQNDLVTRNGVVDIDLVDGRTGNTNQFSAVLRRADVDPRLGIDFRSIVREDFGDLKPEVVDVREGPDELTGYNFRRVFAASSGIQEETPLTTLAACQAGINQMQDSAKAKGFEQMLPFGVYARAEIILENAVAEVRRNPNSAQSNAIAQSAVEAVIDEFVSAVQNYAKSVGKKFTEPRLVTESYMSISFRPVTLPQGMTVEVLGSGDLKLVQGLDKNTKVMLNTLSPEQVDQLTLWRPLPSENAKARGNYIYRLRDPVTRQLLSRNLLKNWIRITARPANGEILFSLIEF
jgi:hypothetical protein